MPPPLGFFPGTLMPLGLSLSDPPFLFSLMSPRLTQARNAGGTTPRQFLSDRQEKGRRVLCPGEVEVLTQEGI